MPDDFEYEADLALLRGIRAIVWVLVGIAVLAVGLGVLACAGGFAILVA